MTNIAIFFQVFLELAPYLKFYSTYANDFEKATKLVEEWTDKHKVRHKYYCFNWYDDLIDKIN